MQHGVTARHLKGKVVDRITREPIVRAHVCLKFKGMRLHTHTTAHGVFEFEVPQSCDTIGLYIAKCGFYPRNIANYLTKQLEHTFWLTTAECEEHEA